MTAKLPYGRQSISDADVTAVVEQLTSPWLTQGPRVEEFEAALVAVTRARFAVAVSSGTAALHLAALAAGVAEGRAGITSANTFVASANCIAYAGGEPAFADVEPDTGLISIAALERTCDRIRRTGKPLAAIIPVDFAGQPAPLVDVQDLARRHGAVVIEDAAHALGASYSDDRGTTFCGSCRDTELAVLSFHPVKHVTTAEGGAILTNDSALHRRLVDLRSHGITKDASRLTRQDGPWYYEQHDLGFNYRLTDLQCALGLSQMRRLDAFLRRRRALAARYDDALAQKPLAGAIAPLARVAAACHAYHLYVVRVAPRSGESLTDIAHRRRTLFDHLAADGIQAQVHYIPVTRQPWYQTRTGVRPADYRGAESYYAGCLSLPLFPDMNESDVDRVVHSLTSWAGR